MVNRRDSVATRLLLACRQSLSERGMMGMFVDGSKYDENVLQSLGKKEHPSSLVFTVSFMGSLGFNKWAEYKEVWRNV